MNFLYFGLNLLLSMNFPFRQMLATKRLPIKLDICLNCLQQRLAHSK